MLGILIVLAAAILCGVAALHHSPESVCAPRRRRSRQK